MKKSGFLLTSLPTLLLLGTVLVASGRSEAQVLVTGAGTVDGFTLAGVVHANAAGNGHGNFQIIVHPTVANAGVVSVICRYRNFDSVAVSGGVATFHSVGSCRALTDNGTNLVYESDNNFAISDAGEPGPGADAVDVNFNGAGGVAVPGNFLTDGNFVVSDSTQ